MDHCSQGLALSSHQFAAKFLGLQEPKAVYDRLSFPEWKEVLNRELLASGLPNAVQELIIEMGDRARIRALLSETDTIAKYFKELRSVQGCVSFLYSPSSLNLSIADENFSRQGEPRTTSIPLEYIMNNFVNNPRSY